VLLPYFSASARRLLALLATDGGVPMMTQLDRLAEFERNLILASAANRGERAEARGVKPGGEPSWRRTNGNDQESRRRR
jgi:DNA invertase Pin-like site-specific DNA recombinase